MFKLQNNARIMLLKSRYTIIFLICLSLLLVSTESLFCQGYNYDNLTEDDGISSNEVYDILASRSGNVWYATDNGIGYYDGVEYVNFDTQDGLPDNTVIKLYEDLFSRIWFLSYNGKLSYYEHGKIRAYKYNDTIVRYFSDNYIGKIHVDSLNNVLVAPRQGGKGIIDIHGNIDADSLLIPYQTDSCYLYFQDLGDDHFLTILSEKPKQAEYHGNNLYSDKEGYYLKVEYSGGQFQRTYLKTDPDEYILSYRNQLYVIKDKQVANSRRFSEELIFLYQDHLGNIWVGEKYDNGVYRFDSCSLESEPTQLLKGYTVTKVTQDEEANFWLSTEGDGIFFTPGFDFNQYILPWDNRNLHVMALAFSGNRIWFSTRDKDIYSAKVSEALVENIRPFSIEEPNDWVKHILIDEDGYLWLSSTISMRYDPAGFPVPLDTVANSNFVGKGKDGTIICTNKRIGRYKNGKLIDLIDHGENRRMYAAFEHGNEIWLGTLYGLDIYRNGRFYSASYIADELQDRVNCITRINDIFVVGTANNGLVFVRGDSLALKISVDDGLLDNGIKSLFAQNDSVLWAGTRTGLNKVILHNTSFEIESYGQADGLPSNEINDIGMHVKHIWLATGNGLVSFIPEKLTPHVSPPRIKITSIQINGRDTTYLDHYDLFHDQNDIRISFEGISFRREGGTQFRYRMSNFNNERVITKNNWASFPNMPPGEYTFYVNVGNVHGIWNDTPKTISFTIHKHFTQTIGFLILLIVFSSLVVFGLTLFIQHQRKMKEQARINLAKMEQKIFRLQMNPHFVFNALLAIQGFMYQRNIHDAGRYLTSFAKLIRHTLYGSREDFISLDKEIEAMQYYLELQRLRFNESFEFHIDVGDDVMPESIQLPPLLIQPFLENAIEHGLQHKKEPGTLYFRIKREINALRIEIEDDGIGREQSLEKQKKKGRLHKSLGMGIVQSRIQSLNRLTGKNITLEIIDLKDEYQNGNGTLVRIMIPD